MQRRFRAVPVFLTLLVAWIAGGSVAHAASWVPGPTLSEGVSQSPHVAMGGDGAATVLWAIGAPSESSGDVVLRRVAADGTAGGVHGVGDGVALDVVSTDGGALAAWATVAAGGDALDVKTVTLDGTDVTRGIRTVSVPTGSPAREPLGAIAPDGAIVVSWLEDDPVVADRSALRARRIAPDGTLGPVVDLSLAVPEESSYQLGVGGDGVARVVWRRPDVVGGGLLVARINPDGTGSTPTILTMDPEGVPMLRVEGGHAIAGWFEPLIPGDPASLSAVRVKRLPSSGAVAGPVATVVPSLASSFRGVGFALAPDGTATVAWSETDFALLSGVIHARRLAPGGALGAVQRVSTPPSSVLDLAPTLANGRDGAIHVAWSRVRMPALIPSVVSRRLGADGVPTGDELPVVLAPAAGLSLGATTLTAGSAATPFLTTLGVAPSGATLLTSRLVEPPVVGPGPPVPGPGDTPAPAPGPGASPVPGVQAPTAKRAAARLKLTKASRKAARVSVAGTIDRRASGRLTVTWRQKAGRKSVTRTSRVRISKGRFATTLELPKSLARSKAAGRLTVTYAGSATLASGKVERTVRPAKARKRS